MVAVWEGSVNGSPHGIMLCIIGTICNAAMMSTSGRILSEKLDVLRLAFYTAPVSCIALFPFCYFREVSLRAETSLPCLVAALQLSQTSIAAS